MARKMRKFSEGGALGKYNRRMADIDKDYKIALAKGKNEGVAKAKYEQRKADAEDDRAKRTGADRTKTKAGEKAAEATLTEARRTKGESVKKRDMATDISKFFAGKQMTAKAAEPEKAKPQSFGAAFKAERARLGAGKTFTFNGERYSTNIAGEGRKPAQRSTTTASTTTTTSTTPKNPPATTAAAAAPKNQAAAALLSANLNRKPGAISLPRQAPKFDVTLSKKERDKQAAEGRNAAFAKVNLTKGGKAMKYRSGGSTAPQPSAAERKADAKFRESVKKEKVTPENAAAIGRGNRSEKRFAAGGVTKEMPSSKAMGSMNMAKGGKAKVKGKAKGNPFAATKFGAAMMKKSADTKGRAMPKFAKGGSIDGCATKGKTKASMVKMARGGKTC